MIGLAFLNPSHAVHSYEQSSRRTNSNGDHTRIDSDLNVNNYCGIDWADAYNTCWMPCPNGADIGCSRLGEEYTCQQFTLCSERIANGQIFPKDPAGNNGSGTSAITTDTPSKQPTPSQTEEAALIAYPSCPDEYSSEAGYAYALGSLVAYPTPRFSTMKGVYECQGENCNAGQGYAPGESDNANLTWKIVGTCDHSTETVISVTVAPTEPTQGTTISTVASTPLFWFPKSIEGISKCAYGENFPAAWLTNEQFREVFLFESEEGCCAAYPENFGCVSTNNNGTAPSITTSPPGVTPGQPTESSGTNTGLPPTFTEIPTSAPTENEDEDTYEPTNGALFLIHGQNVLFGITTIFIALLF